MNRFTALLGVALLMLGATGARANDLPVTAFYGEFQGGAVAENLDSIYFGITARDTDVKIEPAENGFSVSWTSVIRQGGDPSNPNVRRKSSNLTFLPSGRGRIWRATRSEDPLAKGELAWARISGNSLIVYVMVVRDDGHYEIQKYDRKITASGMELVFTRIRDGEQVRTVKGRLVKVAR